MKTNVNYISPNVSYELPSAKLFELKEKGSDNCIVIPVLNEGELIKRQLIDMKTVQNLCDIIVCDGGSTDGCTDLALMKELGVKTLLVRTSQKGMSTQLRLLFSYALDMKYKNIIHMDGNFKDKPDAIPLILKHLNNGIDMVACSRFKGKDINTPLLRKILVRWIHAPLISLAAGLWYTDTTNSYRGYSFHFLSSMANSIFRDVFNYYNLPYYLLIIAAKRDFKIIEIGCTREYQEGIVQSKIRGVKSHLSLLKELIYVCLNLYEKKNKFSDR